MHTNRQLYIDESINMSRCRAAFERLKQDYKTLKNRVEAYLEVCLSHTQIHRQLIFSLQLEDVHFK